MISCAYHPFDDMIVVDDEELEKLVASGEWFRHPNDAKAAREKLMTQKEKKPKGASKNGISKVE